MSEGQGLIGTEINSGKTAKGITSGVMDGGYCIRGDKSINGTKSVYSEYKHYTSQERASVVSGTGVYKDGGWKNADVFSKASATWTKSGTNKAYYDYR